MPVSKPQHFALLLDWMGRSGITQAELGRRLGRPRRDINRLCQGRLKYIDPRLAVALERETAGAVTAADFIAFMSQREAA